MAREKKVTPFVTTSMFVNIFLKVFKLRVGHWNLQVGDGVTRGSVVRHPWFRLTFYSRLCYDVAPTKWSNFFF